MEVSEEVVARAELLIRKPATQVFQAFVDPEVTTKFWFDKPTGPLTDGASRRR